MRNDEISKYNTFLFTLKTIGIDPQIIQTHQIIDSAIKKNNENVFDSLDIIPGPFGELIKVDHDNNAIEIYKIQDYFYSKQVFNIDTGDIIFEEVGDKNIIKDMGYFEPFLYRKLMDNEEKDYSEVRRVMFNDKIKFSSKRIEEKNDLIRKELPELKENISKYLNDFYAHDGVRKIVDKIEDAYNYRGTYKMFDSDNLSNDMLWLINRKLRFDFLVSEKEMFDKISPFPLFDLVTDYSKYGREKEDRIANRINNIASKVYTQIDSFNNRKNEISKKMVFFDGEMKSIKRHTLMYVRRTKELNDKEKY